jgi:hypothetical protein
MKTSNAINLKEADTKTEGLLFKIFPITGVSLCHTSVPYLSLGVLICLSGTLLDTCTDLLQVSMSVELGQLLFTVYQMYSGVEDNICIICMSALDGTLWVDFDRFTPREYNFTCCFV